MLHLHLCLVVMLVTSLAKICISTNNSDHILNNVTEPSASIKDKIDKIEFEIIRRLQKEYVFRKNFCPRVDNENNATHIVISALIRDVRVDHFKINLYQWTVDVTFHLTWNNPRLAYFTIPEYFSEYEYVAINSVRLVWVPDLLFPEEVKREVGAGMASPGSYNVLLWIYPNGDVMYSFRLPSLTLRCRKPSFSADYQRVIICPLSIESYGCTSDKVVLEWEVDDPVEMSERLYIPNYTLLEAETVTGALEDVTRIGNFSKIFAEILLKL